MRKMLGKLFYSNINPNKRPFAHGISNETALQTFAKGFIYGFRPKAKIALEMISDEDGCLRISRSGRPLS